MSRPRLELVPKLCGADVELANFVAEPGPVTAAGTGALASRALLRALASVTPVVGDFASDAQRPQDSHRMYLAANGGCAYIDLDHLELCIPEVRSAQDHVAAWHAMLRIAQQALLAANRDRPRERRIEALVNNSDGRGNSFGSHLSLLLSRRAWDDLLERKLHQLACLAAYQASSLVFTGQGKVGSENNAPAATYQISQRADFIETLLGPQTTFRRPLINTRDEPLCGPGGGAGLARLHLISFDSTLCHTASLLRVGVTQLVLAMLEAGALDHALALDDPLEALHRWSADPGLGVRAPLVDGRRLTAVELQLLFLEAARGFEARHGFAGIVPGAAELLDLWESTLRLLERADWPALARRLDWVLKLAMLERARAQRPGLGWDAPELKYLDHRYSSLDPAEGLYWAWERAGLVDLPVPEERIAHFGSEPPEDTRAFARALLLRAAPREIDRVDWDSIRFRTGYAGYQQLTLPDPLGATRAELEPALRQSASFAELLEALGAVAVPTPIEYLRARLPARPALPWGRSGWSEAIELEIAARRKGGRLP